MSAVKILSAADVERLFTIPMAIEAVQRAYLKKHSGRGAAQERHPARSSGGDRRRDGGRGPRADGARGHHHL